jgi:hypothetical protein
MVTVPQYQRQVKPETTPTQYQAADVNSDMFGGNIARAGSNMGDSIAKTGDAIIEVKRRVDQTKILEIANESAAWEQQNLYDKDNGYYYKTGKDAYGQSTKVLESYDKMMSQKLANAGLSPVALVDAESTIGKFRERISQGVNAHDFKEGVSWSNTEAATGLKNTVNAAVNGRNNPQDIQKQIGSGYQILEWKAGVQHKDADTLKLEKQQYLSSVHEAVLSSYLAEGSLKASEYLQKHKSEISADKLPGFIESVKNNELSYTARSTAQSLLGLPLSEAYTKINAISDPQTRGAVEREFGHLKSQQENVQREYDIQASGEIMQAVYNMYDNGGSMSDIMSKINRSNLSLETKEKIYSNIKEMQELEGAGNNWADYNILLDMASENNERFKNINPAIYNLSKEQYMTITRMQRESKDVQFTPEAKLKAAVKKFDTGFLPGGGLSSGEYQEDLVRFLSKVERLQGKAFDINHLDSGQFAALASAFSYKDPNAKNKNIDEVKELYMRAKKHGDVYDRLAREYQSFKGENKREPNPDELFEMTKRSYNAIETEYRQRSYGKVNNIVGINNAVNATIPQKGETKVLTYTANTLIPQVGRELGIKYTYVDGARYRAGDAGGHGKGRKLDVSMSEHNYNDRIKSFEAFAALPTVTSIGTSDPIILKRFAGNPKLNNLTNWDLNYKKTHPGSTTNHTSHFDISLNTSFGGDAQGNGTHPAINKSAYMTSKK